MSEQGRAPERPLDLLELLATLQRHGVDYVVIGGVAAQAHGHRRTTKDLDIIPSPAPGNHDRLAAALAELKARPRDAPAAGGPVPTADPERLRQAPIVPPLLTRHGELRILNDPKGAGRYDDLRSRALSVDVDGIEVAVVGLDDLIRMKRATGRPADLADIEYLAPLDRPE